MSRTSTRTKVVITFAAVLAGVAIGLLAYRVTRPARASVESQLERSEHESPDLSLGPTMHLGGLIRRSANPDLVFELKPNVHCAFHGVGVDTNSRGFRDREWTVEKPANAMRFALVGDSMLFGPYVRIEKTYARFVEAELQSRTPNARVETLNFGVPGYNSYQEAAVVRDVVFEYSPDVIVLGWVGNDDQLPSFLADSQSDEEGALMRRTELYGNTLPSTHEERQRLRREHPEMVEPPNLPESLRRMVGWPAVEQSIRTIGSLCRDRRVRVLLTLYESNAGPDHDPNPSADRHAALTRLAGESGIEVLDLHPIFTQVARDHGWRDTRPLWVRDDNAHLSEEGHRVFARALIAKIEALGWIPR
ncbi:MAG: hypothetical protein HY292_08575 [Planctomycetes bacterium]|nr:hypothetical protein [Planctomycetota bacterium]